MIDWHPIETAPEDEILLLGCESDPTVDAHMFFVDLGWKKGECCYSISEKDVCFPSHWARLSSPISTAPISYYSGPPDCRYFMNKVYCTICKTNTVDALNGFDICEQCLHGA